MFQLLLYIPSVSPQHSHKNNAPLGHVGRGSSVGGKGQRDRTTPAQTGVLGGCELAGRYRRCVVYDGRVVGGWLERSGKGLLENWQVLKVERFNGFCAFW